MVSRLAAFVIWAAVAASIVFWALRLWVKPAAVPAHARVVSTSSGFNGDLSRLFGVDAAPVALAAAVAQGAPPPPADARFTLVGVVAPRSAAANAQGLALIAMDGKPPKAYRVGSAVDGEMVLQAVRARGATLGPSGQAAQVTLELPALAPPATGTPMVAGAAPPPPRVLPMPGRPLGAAPAPGEPQAIAPQAAPPERSEEEAPVERPTYNPPASGGRARPL